MDIRALWEKAISLRGCLSKLKTETSRRRYTPEEDEDVIPASCPFLGDETKVCASKLMRRAGGLTQVFSFRKSELIRGRLTHMIEASGFSVMAADLFGLNINLVRAGAIFHDAGHSPLGHPGENWIKKTLGRDDYCHEIMGVVAAQKIERKGAGLNLTWHTLRMILRNGAPQLNLPTFPESQLLGHLDGFTYITADANDIGKRGKYTFCQELKNTLDSFGTTQRERIYALVAGLAIESAELGRVSFEHSELAQKFLRLKKLMYETVYFKVTEQGVEEKMEKVLRALERLDVADPFMLLALMTDKDVKFFAEHPTRDLLAFNETAIAEIVEYLPEIHHRHGKIDLCDPDLGW